MCRAARLAGRPKGGAPQRLCLVAPALRGFCVRSWRSRWGVELVFVVGRLRNVLAAGKILGSQKSLGPSLLGREESRYPCFAVGFGPRQAPLRCATGEAN